MIEQLCAMVKAYNKSRRKKVKLKRSPSHGASYHGDLSPRLAKKQNALKRQYDKGIADFADDFDDLVENKGEDHPDVVKQFHCKCQHDKWKAAGAPRPVPRRFPKRRPKGLPKGVPPVAMNPDHCHPAGLNGSLTNGNLKWADARVNQTVGPAMDRHDPVKQPDGIKAHSSCNCKG
jgi:hypothetical protein